MDDIALMKRAIALAENGKGLVSPNPLVGAVIVKDGKIIGEGWHRKFGGPHAEIEAINNAEENGYTTEGSTIYVTLEPCSHYGKTPPCADKLVDKKFSKVVVGMVDPNPLVAGKGLEILKNAGIEIVTGILEDECRWLNRFFIKYITTGMPYVTVKVAQSLNGCIATAYGESKWITGEESLNRVHKYRAEYDAVLIGSGTALADNPQLNVRRVEGRNPKRIILDTNLNLPADLDLFKAEDIENTIICCSPESAGSQKAKELTDLGINIISVDRSSRGLDKNQLLKKLAEELNISSVFVEGGAKIFSAFIEKQLIDELHIFIAPMIIAGGKNAFGDYTHTQLSDALKMKFLEINRSGDDVEMVLLRAL